MSSSQVCEAGSAPTYFFWPHAPCCSVAASCNEPFLARVRWVPFVALSAVNANFQPSVPSLPTASFVKAETHTLEVYEGIYLMISRNWKEVGGGGGAVPAEALEGSNAQSLRVSEFGELGVQATHMPEMP